MLINCDIGERGPDNARDRKLMALIDIANLACGGHAGDKASVKTFRALAEKHGVELAAHLSYPDRKNFGRRVMRISGPELLAALAEQLALLPGVRRVKFHGALYGEACRVPGLAKTLVDWLKRAGIREILAPADSALAAAAKKRGIAVLREAFVDRRYEYDKAARKLRLVDRSDLRAAIPVLPAAMTQAGEIILRRRVDIGQNNSGRPVWKTLDADTICVHSDSPIALALAVRLRRLLGTKGKGAETRVPAKESFRLLKPGMCEVVTLPLYGGQDLALTPGGAMDCFSFMRGNLMLGSPAGQSALEILEAPEIEITAPGYFVLTGACRPARVRSGGKERGAEHSRVYAVRRGDRITFGDREYGLRTYFCFRPGGAGAGDPPVAGAVPFSKIAEWADPEGRIRVLPGPEHGRLEEPRLFFNNSWRTTQRMNKMGMRLAGEFRLKYGPESMISEAVADGTVQLTPEGPIVLLRHRQTTGGYPRIFNVISADIDLLGQYGPCQNIRFVQVTRDQAREFARLKEKALEQLS